MKLGKIKACLESVFEDYRRESETRAEDFGAGYFFKKRNTYVAGVLVIIGFLTILDLVTPPRSIVTKINLEPNTYLQYRAGEVSFNSSKANSESSGHKIELPYRELVQLPGYDPKSIHYQFKIELPKNRFQEFTFGILIPKIWGKSRVYANGQLRDFGTNVWPLLSLESERTIIDIFSDVSETAGRVPISATYPIIVSEKEKLHDLVSTVEEQLQASPRALAAYSLAIILFGFLFVAYPKKPELLAFVIFLGASLLNSLSISLVDQKKLQYFANWNAHQTLVVTLDMTVNFSLFAFTLFFFRAHPKTVISSMLKCLSFMLTVGIAITFFFSKQMNNGDFSQIGRVVTNLTFLGFQLCLVLPRLAFVISNHGVPRGRKIAGITVMVAVAAVYLVNIIDFFTYFTALHTLYSNGLILNLALSSVVAYETSRAEVNQAILGSMLPREVKEGLHLNKKGVDQSGFILLLDAIGYSADRNRFDDIDERTSYIEKLAQAMLKPVHELRIPNFSILNCTGDGLYCAVRGNPSKENFEMILEVAKRVTAIPVAQSESSIRFRAAVGYGGYGVRIIEYGSLRKEFVAGNILNDLSRVIGSSSDTASIRILVNDKTRELISGRDLKSVSDKHGFEHTYVDLKETKVAA